jgi:hypothetical protein
VRGINRGAALHVRAHDLGTSCARKVGQLGHLVTHYFGISPGEQHTDEIDPLPRDFRRDQSLSFLILVIASSRRASGAVTDSRK